MEAYKKDGIFDLCKFFTEYQDAIPIHTATFCADVGCTKGASANVESIFSGVKRLLGDFAATMSPEVLQFYVFIHYNWSYDWMRPSIADVVKAYEEKFGNAPLPEDNAGLCSDDESDCDLLE